MKATKEIKKKKVIADLLEKKFNRLDKLVGGVGCGNGKGEQHCENRWPEKCWIAG